jgi:hypothetical protein
MESSKLINYLTNMCQSGQGTFLNIFVFWWGWAFNPIKSGLKDMGWLLLVYKTHKIETWLVVEGKGKMTPPQRMVAKSHPQSCYWIVFNSPSVFAPSGYTTWGSIYTWNMQILWANYIFIPTLEIIFLFCCV